MKTRPPTRHKLTSRGAQSSSTDAEIAELEQRLAELKKSGASAFPISPASAVDLLADEESRAAVTLLDVRTPEEVSSPPFLAPHWKKVAASVSLTDASAMNAEFLASNNIGVDSPVIVYCKGGGRASVALAELQKLGCTKVTNGGSIENVISTLATYDEPAAASPITVAAAAESPSTVQDFQAADEGFDMSTLSTRQKVANIKGVPATSELVSEAWKESPSADVDGDSAGGGGVGLFQIIGGAVAVILISAFSQVPAGTDVSLGLPASEIRAESPADIKARFEAAK
jgi:rhodanese-related sulfurtransferase